MPKGPASQLASLAWLAAILMLLVIPLASAGLLVVCLLRTQPFYRDSASGGTRMNLRWTGNEIDLGMYTDGVTTPPVGGNLLDLPGVRIDRTVLPRAGRTSHGPFPVGDAITHVRVNGWMLALAHAAPVTLGCVLLYRARRRRLFRRGFAVEAKAAEGGMIGT